MKLSIDYQGIDFAGLVKLAKWRDSTEVERSLWNLVLDSFTGSRVQTPLEAKIIEKSIQVSRVTVFTFKATSFLILPISHIFFL